MLSTWSRTLDAGSLRAVPGRSRFRPGQEAAAPEDVPDDDDDEDEDPDDPDFDDSVFDDSVFDDSVFEESVFEDSVFEDSVFAPESDLAAGFEELRLSVL